ncbi:putative metalloprotease CJM1_0395 family protein, partial [Arthrospira platensis SPKY1]|nr:putative metalloprotease CJM1_0395 family protein [Arthrospira platensis SPKY1]
MSPASATTWVYAVQGMSPYASAAREKASGTGSGAPAQGEQQDARAAEPAAASTGSAGRGELSESELRELQQLQQRDREVRAHEMAHVAAGAGLVTRGASYTYQTGPDGQRYAIGGEVSIDTSP